MTAPTTVTHPEQMLIDSRSEVQDFSRLSRRDLIKWLIAAGVLGTTTNATWHTLYSEIVAISRTERPRLLENIPPHSIGFGLSPTNDDVRQALAVAQDLDVTLSCVNIFLKGFGERGDFWYHQARMAGWNGVTPMFSWGHSHYTYRQLIQLCEYLKSIEYPVVLRPFFEMNSTWAHDWWWRGKTDPAQECIRHFRDIREALWRVGADNVTVLWCAHDTVNPFNTHSFLPYYPGDDAVDRVGIDVYGKYRGEAGHPLHPHLNPATHVGPDIAILQAIAQRTGSPIWVPEINTTDQVNGAAWLLDTIRFLARCGVTMIMPFVWNKPTEHNWALSGIRNLTPNLRKELKKECYR